MRRILWILLLSCGPTPSSLVAEEGAAPVVEEGAAVEEGPAAARLQAARAAPLGEAAWSGPWSLEVWSDTQTPESKALAAHLGVQEHTGTPPRTQLAAGTAAVMWVPADADLDAVANALRAPPGAPPGGAVVVVLGPGDEAWRTDASASLPWAGVELVDPAAEAARFGAAEVFGAGAPGAEVRATLAARALAERFDTDWQPLSGALPPALAPILGDPDAGWLDDPDPRVRAEAIRRLQPTWRDGWADDDVAVRLALADRFGAELRADPDPLVRARTVDHADHAAATAALRDGSSVVRVIAAHRLAVLAHQGQPVGAALRDAATSPDAYVRWKAAWGLAAVSGSRPLLESMLADRDADVRRQAARSLGQLGDRAAVPALITALSDENSFVRRWAADALGQLGDRGARPALTSASHDPTLLVAAAASRALAALGEDLAAPPHYQPPPPPADDAAVRALAADRDATRRKDLCKFIAGQDRYLDVLSTLLQDRDSEVRKTAAEALGWTAAGVPLLQAAVDDPDPDVIVTALMGLRRQRAGAADSVRARMDDADAEIRLRAVQALAATPDLSASDRALLARHAGATDERERAAVVAALPELLAPGEAAVLVLRAAAAGGGAVRGGVLVQAAATAADPGLSAWAAGVIAREDDLLHERMSWNDPADRPDVYGGLRPPVIRPYGDPDRG